MPVHFKNATIVDGTGADRYVGSVNVDGGKIVGVGDVEADAGAEVVDCDGLVLAPGFIDLHTHYDAQVLWDPDLTPSCWHGITTVVMGNCGFGIAPTRASDRSTIVHTLENVEGMSANALEAGISWDFESFPQFLDAVRKRGTRLNVGAFVGHTPVRFFVLGDEATERAATETELEQMQALVHEAMLAGAMGFSTSQMPGHVGAGGLPVPSRLADQAEIVALGATMGATGRGVMQITIGGAVPLDYLNDLAGRIGRPVTYTALVTGLVPPGETLELADRAEAIAPMVWPQISCRPLVMQLVLDEPYMVARIPEFTEILDAPADRRAELYRAPEWRRRAKAGFDEWARDYDKAAVIETDGDRSLIGRPIAEVAQERGTSPFDTLVDIALADQLRTRFQFTRLNDNVEEVGALLNKPQTVLGLSDAGAHGDSLCDACFSTDLLGTWVRGRQALTLEAAVWRLAGQPARLMDMSDRGVIREGNVADIVCFDAERIGPGPLERVWDLPAGANRLIAPGIGIEHVFVGGHVIRRDGADVEGARPGVLISS